MKSDNSRNLDEKLLSANTCVALIFVAVVGGSYLLLVDGPITLFFTWQPTTLQTSILTGIVMAGGLWGLGDLLRRNGHTTQPFVTLSKLGEWATRACVVLLGVSLMLS